MHISRVLNFPPENGKNDPFPAGKNRENGKKSYSRHSFYSCQIIFDFSKLTLIKQILPETGSLCYKDNSNCLFSKIGQILIIFEQFLANFSQNREISRENSHFPPGNFPVDISRFPFSHREMCNSNGDTSITPQYKLKQFEIFHTHTYM